MDTLNFKNKEAFWTWLEKNHQMDEGHFLKFDKKLVTSTLKPDEALDVALCFGWIDGILKRIDDQFYIKYFAKRRPKSIWSSKNKASAYRLIKDGLMMPSGMEAVYQAQKDGRWDKADLSPHDFNMDDFEKLLLPYPEAYEQYKMFSSSIRKTYAMSYYVLKKEESRANRLKTIIERLENHLKPM